MINRILNKYLKSLQEKGIVYDTNFIETEQDRISELLKNVNLPLRVIQNEYIDYNKSDCSSLKSLYNTFEDCCYSKDSTLVCVERYNICAFIVASLVEKLYTRCLVENVTIPSILYIDTEEFVNDLGHIISKNKNEDNIAPIIKTPLEIINKYIYDATFVFWDRFRLDFSSYYNNYIYEILKSRYNDCKANLYFTDKSFEMFLQDFDKNTLDIINIKNAIYDVSKEMKNIKIVREGE